MKILLFLIKAYRLLFSPFLGMHCRFTPSCSMYAMEAIEMYGAIKGSYLAIKRILRCHPFADGGYDPVVSPENEHDKMAKDNRKTVGAGSNDTV